MPETLLNKGKIKKSLFKRLFIMSTGNEKDAFPALFHDLCKHGKWHKIQNGARAGKSQDGLPPVIAY